MADVKQAKARKPRKGPAPEPAAAGPTEVSFDYIKSNFFRVVHVDGVIGGITPNGYIHMAVWNQRAPLPDRVTHGFQQDGSIGKEDSRVQRESIIRELEAGLVFDPEMCKVMIRWLSKQVEDLELLRSTEREQ